MAVKKAVPQTYKNLWPLPATTVLVSCVGASSVPNIITIGACGIACAHPPLISLYQPKRNGVTFYVSKLGDHSDGLSWATAYTTIQAALDAIPDDRGGHHVFIRPDTYMEGNLHPVHRGALGSYNTIEADFRGALGSGTCGYAVIDSSDPERGMQSVDWWGVTRCTPEFSGVDWDRWIVRHVYATGGDGGLFWDLPPKIEPFSILVEDSVGIGRAFGGGVAHVLPRADEPIVFQRCQLWSLDWWGDAAGAYVRVENDTMPDHPDVTFEECVLVGAQCSLKSGNPSFSTYSRVALRRCHLVTLNFSQPHGTPTEGILQSVVAGRYLHVDLEDTTMMGYKVFGVRQERETVGDIGYTTSGCVRAYVQFQQDVPAGIQRLGYWPVETFSRVRPPEPPRPPSVLIREGVVRYDLCELSPVVWKDRLCHLECVRPGRGGTREDYFLSLKDTGTDEERTRFATGYGLASAWVHNGILYAFASRFEKDTWNDVTLFTSSDLVHWEARVVIQQDPAEHLFNTSVCAGPDGFVMAYETNDPSYPAFSIKYARSDDLEHWTQIPGVVFGANRYTACPCIRYAHGYYYQLYLEHRVPRWFFETFVARSKDLRNWELSPANPVLTPEEIDDGTNASDPEIVEMGDKIWVYYAVGDQRTWMNIKRARYNGTMQDFFEQWFARGGIPDRGTVGGEIEGDR